MKKIVRIFLLILLPLIYTHLYVLQTGLLVPIQITPQKSQTMEKLRSIGLDSNIEQIAKSVEIASKQSGISPEFLIALMYSESTGNIKAVSNKGYNGLMQIPQKVHYADANVLIGAHIFNEKMRQANNDLVVALCLYKGYPVGSSRGIMQARKVLALRDRLKRRA